MPSVAAGSGPNGDDGVSTDSSLECPSPATLSSIVVAVDNSQDSLGALHWAMTHLYRHDETALIILHVVPDVFDSPAPGSIYYEEAFDLEVEAAVEAQARSFVERYYLSEATARGIPARVVLVREGITRHIGWAVSKAAEQLQACPLVLATHKQSPWEAMLLGSVAKFCASHCKQPVLLIPPTTQ